MRSRGTIELSDQTQVGVFDSLGRLRAGRVTVKADGAVYEGFYDAQTKRHGYAVDVFPDGSFNEQLFEHGSRAGPVIGTRSNGAVITGMVNIPGYQIFGMMRAANGSVTPTGLTAGAEYVTLPPAEHERARALAAQAAAALLAERARYRAAIEEMSGGPATLPAPPADANDAGCARGTGSACAVLGVRYTDGDGVAVDLRRGASLFDKACTLGDPRGCMLWGYALQYGRGTLVDVSRAGPAYERACAGADGFGCNNLGTLYQSGLGVARDETNALALYTQACAMRIGLGCRNLGVLHADAVTLRQDRALAVAAFDKGCELGDMDSCNKQGWHVQLGLGSERNIDKARRLYAKACDGGYALACENGKKLR